MKDNKAVLLAVIILIGLVSWLLVISLHRDREFSKGMERINRIETAQPETIDYLKISEITKKQIADQLAKLPTPKDGTNGSNGSNGANGNNGESGRDGRDGVNGKSAYELWLDAGNEGTMQDFLNWLKGEKGDPGQTPQLRLNPITGVVETKLPTDFFWQVVPTCTEGC